MKDKDNAPWWLLLAIVCLAIIIWVTMDQWGRVREAGGRSTSPAGF